MNWLRRLLDRLRGIPDTPPDPDSGPIKHVIVLMFENHSFDQMLGCFKTANGVDPDHPGINKDSAGIEYRQRQHADPVVSPDPKHELEHILNQLKGGNGGFVSEYEKEYSGKNPDLQRIMDYFGMGDLPALHALARDFTICDQWFSSVPGPTWTNRFFVHSGTSMGRVRMPDGWDQNPLLYTGYDQTTIYDRLNEKGILWKIYHGDVPQSLVLGHQQVGGNPHRYEWLDQFFRDANGPEQGFPAYAFIEPNYFHIPFEQPQNDDHPPHSTIPAQALLGKVYNALRGNGDLWNSSLLVVLYDEHGGFYDHVEPPDAVVPDEHQEEWTFHKLGVRVPALLVSPWVDRGVLSTKFDHASLLKFLTDKWQLGPLTERVAKANSFGSAIRTTARPPTDTPERVPIPATKTLATPGVEDEGEPLNENQKALEEFTEHLEKKTALPTASRTVMAATPGGQAKLAKERVREFLAEKKAELPGP
jgi:phospholipase C